MRKKWPLFYFHHFKQAEQSKGLKNCYLNRIEDKFDK